MALSNSGTVNANASGQALLLNGGGVTNTNLLEASSGGYLQISGLTVNNSGGNITANGSSNVQLLNGASIQGGTLTNNGNFFGTLTGHSASLDGSTGAGAITLNGTYTSDLNTNTYLLGTITNNNNIQVNGGSGSNTALIIDSGNVILQGGGTVTLTTLTGGGNAFIEQAAGGLTLTNVNNTIQGSGIIGQNGLTIINQAGGIINANSTGGSTITSLTIQGATSMTNAGLMEATNSGVLNINGVVVNNAGGNITANGAGATVQLFGNAQIQGGTLTNNGGAFFGTPAGNAAFLDGTTQGPLSINGTYTSDLNTNTYLLGTITNNNNIQVNGGSGSNTALIIDSGNVILQGGGTVTLTTLTGGGNAFIEQAAGGLTLTNVNNTIQGSGIIGQNGLTIVNQAGGIINANSTGGSTITSLTIQGATSMTNAGLMEATNSGVLNINGVVVNNAGGNITANGAGAAVQLYGSAVIQGGTLTNNGGAFFGTPAGNAAFLDGSTGAGAITLNGTYTSDLNTSTYLLGTIKNQGNIQVNGGSGFNTVLLIDSGNVTLQGGGTMTLTTLTGGGNAFIEQAAGGLTLTNVDNTIQGSGIIGNNGLSLINQTGGTILANAPSKTLFLSGLGSLTNNGTFKAANGGALQVDSLLSNFNDGTSTLTGGTYTVDGTGAASTMKFAFTANGQIANNAANITLKGANANVHFINNNGVELLNSFASNTGSFTIDNGYNFQTPSNFSNAGTVTVGDASILAIGSGNNYNQTGGLTQGTGTIVGNVNITGGTFKPGLSPGTITNNGNFNLSNATFQEEIAVSDNGLLNVINGNLALGSGALLEIDLLGGFNPLHQLFTIMTYADGSLSGMFANAQGNFQMDGYNWTINYNYNNLNEITLYADSRIGPAPLPGTWLLLGSALLGLAGWRKRQR